MVALYLAAMRWISLVVVIIVVGLVSPVAYGEPGKVRPSAEKIRGWIEQLGSPQFAQREEASRALAAAGVDAVDQLTAAAVGPDLEASSRAIDVLGGFLASDEPALAAAAEKAIEQLVDGPDGTAQQMSRAALDFHHVGLAKEAMERIESLGGRILPTELGGFHVVINSSWRGTVEDLKYLSRVRGIIHVGIHGVKLDEAATRFLARVRGLQRLELYGTGLTNESRLAHLVPQPRKHRHRHHGVFAPHHKLRPAVTDCLGQAHGAGGGGVSARVPELRWRHPADRVHYGAGADPKDSHTPRRTTRAAYRLSRSWPAHRLGANSCRSTTTGQSFRSRLRNYPQSTSTAFDRRRTRRVEAQGTADWDTVCADARKTPPKRVRGVSRHPLRTPGPRLPRATSRSSAGNAGGRAIGRAILERS